LFVVVRTGKFGIGRVFSLLACFGVVPRWPLHIVWFGWLPGGLCLWLVVVVFWGFVRWLCWVVVGVFFVVVWFDG